MFLKDGKDTEDLGAEERPLIVPYGDDALKDPERFVCKCKGKESNKDPNIQFKNEQCLTQ